jgi:hypothetical protein
VTDGAVQKLAVQVWDWNRIESHSFMGEFHVTLTDLEPGETYNRWFLLSPMKKEKGTKEKNLGEIRLAMRYTEQELMPKACYEEMIKLLLEDDLIIPISLGEVTTERDEVANALLRTFFCRHKALLLVKALTSHEINITENVDIIFRGNSLATKVRAYGSYIGDSDRDL